MNLLLHLYALVLRLYPSSFRSEFADEMQAVFAEALQDASKRGRLTYTWFFLREMGDLPSSLLSQFWSHFCSWVMLPWQDQASLDSNDSRSSSWLSAGLAALPHLFYALALYLPLLVTVLLRLPNYRGPALPMFWGMTGLALICARRLSWPRWSSSWIGYGLVFLLEQITTLFPSGPQALLADFVWLSLAAILLFWLARRDWMSGLLAVFPITPVWIWLARVDYPPETLDSAALYLSISLMVSLAVIAIVRLGRWQTALLLILVLILATGMPDSYAGSRPGNAVLEFQPAPSSLSGANSWIAGYTLMLISTAPLWLMALWRQAQRRRTQRAG